MSFLADLDSCLSDLNEKDTDAINDLNAAAVWYRKQTKRQKGDRTLNKVRKFLKENRLKAVPFDKGVGFCIMTEETYWQKLESLMDGPQFEEKTVKEDPTQRLETNMNKKLTQLYKDGKITKTFCENSRSVGAQPARLYGLAKVHKPGVPLRPVLSLPGSHYENLTNELATLLEKLPGSGIGTSTEQVRDSLSGVRLQEDETVISLDVKSLYTNVPVDESISLAVD